MFSQHIPEVEFLYTIDELNKDFVRKGMQDQQNFLRE